MSTTILYETDTNQTVTQKLINGVSKLSNAVTTTLGPRGRNVTFMKNGEPVVTHDGVTIAKEVSLEDKCENIGCKLVLQAAVKTNTSVGDGTTSSILLAHHMIQEGYKIVTSGYNPMLVRKGITKGAELVSKYIESISQPVTTKEDMTYVASISCQDDELGEQIANAFEMVEQGNVVVNESKSNNIEINHLDGMRFEKGFISQYFVNDEEENKCVLDSPLVLLTEQKIMSLSMIVPIIEKMLEAGHRSLFIITEQLSDAAIRPLILNKLSGSFEVCAVEPPSYGDNRKKMLEDIAIATGGVVNTTMLDKKIEDFELSDLGRCERVIVSSDKTVILNGGGEKDTINERLTTIKTQMENETQENKKTNYQDRIQLLAGGVAEIAVGAPTEAEQKEKKMLVEDAVNALVAAQKGGIVAGGGITYLMGHNFLEKHIEETSNVEVRMGMEVVRKALLEPTKKIAYNGGENGDVVLNNIFTQQKINNNDKIGYNVMNGEYVNMIDNGIIEPSMVLTSAIRNSASVTNSILTTDAVIIPQEKNN